MKKRDLITRLLLSETARLLCEADVRELLTLARARLARWIAPKRKPPIAPQATIAEVLAARGYQEIPLVPRPAREIGLPSVAQLEHMRGVGKLHGAPAVKICRGSDKGCGGAEDLSRCEDCYTVHWWDKRHGGEILEAIKRGDA